jgi:hypothetical protein
MTTTTPITATGKVPMDSLRKTALVAGVFYLITFISIPTLLSLVTLREHLGGAAGATAAAHSVTWT